MSNSEESEPPHPETLKTLAQLQIERLKREDEEEQWISGEELYTEGSSDEDDGASKRRSEERHGKLPRKNLKGAIPKERKHGVRKSHGRPASASPSRTSLSSTKQLTSPVFTPPESQFKNLLISERDLVDDFSKVDRTFEEGLKPPQQSGSSTCTLSAEMNDEQAEISWRPKRGNLKICESDVMEEPGVFYSDIIERLRNLRTFASNGNEFVSLVGSIDEEIKNITLKSSAQNQESFYLEPLHNIECNSTGNIDENVRSAFLKMNKLDALLQFTTEKEREARDETVSLQLHIRKELEQLGQSQGPENSELAQNMTLFYKLCSVPENEDKIEVMNDLLPNEVVTHIAVVGEMNADVLEEDYNDYLEPNKAMEHETQEPIFSTELLLPDREINENETNKDSDKKKLKSKGKNADFISRNIKLAADGMGTLSITDEEKQKLAELLKDLDEKKEEEKSCTLVVKDQLNEGQGYSMDSDTQSIMKDIDSRLEAFGIEYESRSESYSNDLETSVKVVTEGGIHALKELQVQQRLLEIDNTLTNLNEPVNEEIEPLENKELQRLVEQYSTCSSTTALIDEAISSLQGTDSVTSVTTRSDDSSKQSSRLTVTTQLSADVVVKLVEQARHYMPHFKFRHAM